MTAAVTTQERSTSWVPVSLALAKRALVGIVRVPAAVIPLVAMPVFFVVAFSGSFSRLSSLPSFPVTDSVLNWFVPFAIIQGSAFAGFGTGFATVREIETGFYDRLLLAPGSRVALLVGPILAGIVRCTITVTIVLAFGFALGARLPGGLVGLAVLWLTAVGMATISTGWALGLVYRVPNQRAGPFLQIGIFFSTFLSTGNVPLADQIGWTKPIARVNPITNMLQMARQGFLGEVTWAHTWPGLLGIAGSLVVLWTFAATGIKKLTA